MKTQDEVQRVHDMLTGILLGECKLDTDLDEKAMMCLSAQAHVLCWILGHKHEDMPDFGALIEAIEDLIVKSGYRLEDHSN